MSLNLQVIIEPGRIQEAALQTFELASAENRALILEFCLAVVTEAESRASGELVVVAPARYLAE